MVDRQAAIGDWRRFLDLAESGPGWKSAVTRVEERLRTLEAAPALPELLEPVRYVPESGDYYDDVAQESVGLQWNQFPVKVFEESPSREWQQATQEGFDGWLEIFPLQLVTTRGGADIVVSWYRMPKNSDGTQPSGDEHDLIEIEKENDKVVRRRKRSLIALDTSRRSSKDEMRATVAHELGHALGIKGHSSNLKDVMFPEEVEVFTELEGGQSPRSPYSRGPSGVESRLVVSTKLTRRDINTLIRLYNCARSLSLLR